MTISVVIPTYRRVKELERCLKALKNQLRCPDEIVVIVRDSDEETQKFLRYIEADYPKMQVAKVIASGQVAALNAGLDKAKGDIVSFVDDDVVPHHDWLKRIEEHFQADPKVGGVAGRDWLYVGDKLLEGKKKIIGKVSWYGRIINNHHFGIGKAREVDHFKGTNMNFRREALEGIHFDMRLRGVGAQYRNDLALSLAVKLRGWKLIYDPQVAVDHYFAQRYEEDQRDGSNLIAINNGAHNETLVLLEYLTGMKKIVSIFYAIVVGTLFTPGLVQWFRLILRKEKQPWLRLCASFKGRWEGWKTWRQSKKQNEKI